MFSVSNENILGSDLFYLIVTIELSTTQKNNNNNNKILIISICVNISEVRCILQIGLKNNLEFKHLNDLEW